MCCNITGPAYYRFHALCFFSPSVSVSSFLWLSAPAGPQGMWRLMEAVVLGREWSACTPVARPISHSPFDAVLGVKCQSGSPGWTGTVALHPVLTPTFEKRKLQEDIKEERIKRKLKRFFFYCYYLPSSFLVRWFLSFDLKSLIGRRTLLFFFNDASHCPVVLQTAVQHCLSQHMNNSLLQKSVYINKSERMFFEVSKVATKKHIKKKGQTMVLPNIDCHWIVLGYHQGIGLFWLEHIFPHT